MSPLQCGSDAIHERLAFNFRIEGNIFGFTRSSPQLLVRPADVRVQHPTPGHLAFSCALLTIGVGCGSMNPAQTMKPSTQAQVSVSPNNVTLAPGAQHRFSATVSGTSNTAVTWAASNGTIASDGTFTAPTAIDGTRITVTASLQQPTQTAVGFVTIQSTPPLSITTSTLSGAVVNSEYDSKLLRPAELRHTCGQSRRDPSRQVSHYRRRLARWRVRRPRPATIHSRQK